jgi:methylated-DNA-protein-cysteine methyltransferase-like protein
MTAQYGPVWQVVASIPPGRVCSYGGVAALAGLPGNARLVGRILSQLPLDSALPWHRVINAGGRISFTPESEAWREQRRRLEAEGVEFSASDRVSWKRFGWPDQAAGSDCATSGVGRADQGAAHNSKSMPGMARKKQNQKK